MYNSYLFKAGVHEVPPQYSGRKMKFHTEDPQILDTVEQNLAATATWYPGFVHP